jgi:hypothetical protein
MILALLVATRDLGQGVVDNVQAALVVLVLLLSVPAFFVLLMTLGKKLIKDEKRQDRILHRWGLPYIMAVGVLVVLYAIFFNPLAWLWLYLFVGLFSFAALVNSILSPGMQEILTEPVHRPRGLARWDDLYASADPVPNGPTRPIGVSDKSIEIWNLGSVFADHTAYWNNRDGFVLRVARVCAETAQSQWVSELPGESDWMNVQLGGSDSSRWRGGAPV